MLPTVWLWLKLLCLTEMFARQNHLESECWKVLFREFVIICCWLVSFLIGNHQGRQSIHVDVLS